mmetsp:Transcript_8788/g.35941  ORF Transcript_8788/g.35941 Transcript_8788/m.35941 type:complete len:292 (-) Transcript_8788:5-880(-)
MLLLVLVVRLAVANLGELKLGPGALRRLVNHGRLHPRGHPGRTHRVRHQTRAEPLRQRDLLLDPPLLLLLEGGGVVGGDAAGFDEIVATHSRGRVCIFNRRLDRVLAASGLRGGSAHGSLGGVAGRTELGHEPGGGLLESADDVQGLAQLAAAVLGLPGLLAALDARLYLGDVAGSALGLVRGHGVIGHGASLHVGRGALLRDRDRGGERGGEGGDGRVGREPVERSPGLGGPGHEHAVHLVRVRGGAVAHVAVVGAARDATAHLWGGRGERRRHRVLRHRQRSAPGRPMV